MVAGARRSRGSEEGSGAAGPRSAGPYASSDAEESVMSRPRPDRQGAAKRRREVANAIASMPGKMEAIRFRLPTHWVPHRLGSVLNSPRWVGDRHGWDPRSRPFGSRTEPAGSFTPGVAVCDGSHRIGDRTGSVKIALAPFPQPQRMGRRLERPSRDRVASHRGPRVPPTSGGAPYIRRTPRHKTALARASSERATEPGRLAREPRGNRDGGECILSFPSTRALVLACLAPFLVAAAVACSGSAPGTSATCAALQQCCTSPSYPSASVPACVKIATGGVDATCSTFYVSALTSGECSAGSGSGTGCTAAPTCSAACLDTCGHACSGGSCDGACVSNGACGVDCLDNCGRACTGGSCATACVSGGVCDETTCLDNCGKACCVTPCVSNGSCSAACEDNCANPCTGGSCGTACMPNGSCSSACLDNCGNSCSGGSCGSSCAPGGVCDEATCLDHCGNPCSGGSCGSTCTSNGSCDTMCQDNCGNFCTTGSCTDFCSALSTCCDAIEPSDPTSYFMCKMVVSNADEATCEADTNTYCN
jgi:hypothetical protein